MQKVSEIISKEIVSIYECERVGTIKNVIFSNNYKKVIAFVFFDELSDYDSGVLTRDVFSFSEDGVLIKNISKIEYHFNEEKTPMNKKVFSLSGEDFGKINDVIFDQNFNVVSFQTTKGKSFLPQQVFKMGFDTCIIKQEEEKVKISSFKPKKRVEIKNPLLDSISVKLVKINQEQNLQNADGKISMPKFPVKVQANLESLIGKTSQKTITGLNNEIIVRQNATISQHTINMAKVHNKTAELLFNT